MNCFAIVRTPQRANECFGVDVVSEAKDGVAPELNPGWVHRWINIYPEARLAPYLARKSTSKNEQTVLGLTQRASITLPSTGLPDPIRALRRPWLRLP